jgi:hypothetical protein
VISPYRLVHFTFSSYLSHRQKELEPHPSTCLLSFPLETKLVVLIRQLQPLLVPFRPILNTIPKSIPSLQTKDAERLHLPLSYRPAPLHSDPLLGPHAARPTQPRETACPLADVDERHGQGRRFKVEKQDVGVWKGFGSETLKFES